MNFSWSLIKVSIIYLSSCTSRVDTGNRPKLVCGPGECKVHLQCQIQSTRPPLHMDQVSVPKTAETSSVQCSRKRTVNNDVSKDLERFEIKHLSWGTTFTDIVYTVAVWPPFRVRYLKQQLGLFMNEHLVVCLPRGCKSPRECDGLVT